LYSGRSLLSLAIVAVDGEPGSALAAALTSFSAAVRMSRS
jgi:hypothetical protein